MSEVGPENPGQVRFYEKVRLKRYYPKGRPLDVGKSRRHKPTQNTLDDSSLMSQIEESQ